MAQLQAVVYPHQQAEARVEADEPTLACEICGNVLPISQMRSIKVSYAVAGPDHPSFECPSGQHWGCCHEHAEDAAIACIKEHLRNGPHGGA